MLIVSAARTGGPERAPQQNNANAPAAPPKEDSKGKDESLKLRLDLNLYGSTLYMSLNMSNSSLVRVQGCLGRAESQSSRRCYAFAIVSISLCSRCCVCSV